MMTWLASLVSQAALSALLRFLSKAAVEDLLVTLIAQAMRYAASKTENKDDDAFVERLIERAKAKNE